MLEVSCRNSQGYPEIVLGGIEFVFIKGGEFEMGCFNQKEQPLLKDARLHRVRLSGFWLSTKEITFGQFGGRYYYGASNYPVCCITWTSAYDFARKFGQRFKRFGPKFELNSNLPTETQWEYVARNGGKKTVYPWGNDVSCQKACYRNCYWTVKPVASYAPNKFGIFDLSGNVREWCRDVYSKDYYSQSPIKNPVNTQGGSERVVRGGSCVDHSMQLKTYVRYSQNANSKDQYTGFRIVLENR